MRCGNELIMNEFGDMRVCGNIATFLCDDFDNDLRDLPVCVDCAREAMEDGLDIRLI